MSSGKYVVIRDEHSKLFGHRFLNSQLSFWLGLVQLLVCLWALAQHIWSWVAFDKILHCDFSDNSTLPPLLTHVDAIIFDVGLFHHLWGITGCVAQHLDGGYGRFCWCVLHILALGTCLPFAFVSRPKPHYLWPLLIQQSAYGVGLLILSLAALPKAAHMIGNLPHAPVKAVVIYSLGTLMNFFLLYVYWHWYWHVESLWNSVRKLRRGETFSSSQRRPFRRSASIGGPVDNGKMGEMAKEKRHQQTPISRQHQNGHLQDGPKKHMSVSIVANGSSGLRQQQLGSLPITRIEPDPIEEQQEEEEESEREEEEKEDELKEMADNADEKGKNFKSSLSSGRNPTEVDAKAGGEKEKEEDEKEEGGTRRRSTMAMNKNGPRKESSTSTRTVAGTNKPMLNKTGANCSSMESNTSAASTATTTTATINQRVPAGVLIPGEQMLPWIVKDPPSPAPRSVIISSAATLSAANVPMEALPPRVRHLRYQGGSSRTTKPPPAQPSGPPNRKSSSAGSTVSILEHEAHSNSTTGRSYSAAFLPCTRRQHSLRQKRRLSLRQRNKQMAARKEQGQQQQQNHHQQGQWPGEGAQGNSLESVLLIRGTEQRRDNCSEQQRQELASLEDHEFHHSLTAGRSLPLVSGLYHHHQQQPCPPPVVRPLIPLRHTGWSSSDHFYGKQAQWSSTPVEPVKITSGRRMTHHQLDRTNGNNGPFDPQLSNGWPKQMLNGPLSSLPALTASILRMASTPIATTAGRRTTAHFHPIVMRTATAGCLFGGGTRSTDWSSSVFTESPPAAPVHHYHQQPSLLCQFVPEQPLNGIVCIGDQQQQEML